MSRVLYVDCVGGVAGDMLLGALLDVGASRDHVAAGLASLPLEPLELRIIEEQRKGIRAVRAVPGAVEEAAHRGLADVRRIVDAGDLPDRVRERVHDAFRRLAVTEARIHGVTPDEIEFHEVGARDAIADVCGVALALDSLRPDAVVVSPIPVARGFVDAAHGRLPLPAPAALELLVGAPVYGIDTDVELVTPTGAALVAVFADRFGPVPAMQLDGTGYGAGARDLDFLPNVVRVLVGTAMPPLPCNAVSLLAANLDDLAPELVAEASARCFAAGALDVWAISAQMKKGRLGVVLSALARPDAERAVAEALMRETTTLGVRVSRLERWELEREVVTVRVRGEAIRLKVGRLDGEVVNVAPEYDDCADAAHRLGVPAKVIWEAAMAAASDVDGCPRG